jgi:hypothetical protein
MAAGKPSGPSISNETRPVLADSSLNTDSRRINYSNTIYHNGVTFNFASGVTWGRYISGDPWVLVSGPGITLSSIEPGLTMVATGVTFYSFPPGKTLMINGSALNKKTISDGFTNLTWGITLPSNRFQPFDSRDNKWDPFIYYFYSASATASQGITLSSQVGLSYGDMIISSISSFNSLNSNSNDPPFTEIRYTNKRALIKQYSILNAVSSIPSVDSYRPPLFWPDPKTRPTFKESDYARNINNHLISFSGSTANLRTMTGETLSATALSVGLNDLTYTMKNSFNSSWVFQPSGDYPNINGGHDSLQPANSFPVMQSGWPSNIIPTYIYPHFCGMFIKEIPFYVRQKSLRRITQLGIDCYGALMDGARAVQHGGQGMCYYLPWVRFAGWLFNNSTMLNIHNNSKLATYVNAGMTGADGTVPPFPKALYNYDKDRFNKIFGFAEYHMYLLAYAFGATANGEYNKWFNIANPAVNNIPYDQGLDYTFGYPNGFTGANITASNPRRLWSQQGMTGVGGFFKYSGITLNPTTPYQIVNSVQIVDGPIVSGSFGKLNLTDRFKPRSKNGTHPEISDSTGQARNCNFRAYIGQVLKITDGGGSGPTEYRIVRFDGIHEAAGFYPLNHTFNVSITLDRNFQHGLPDSTSVINIYPFSSTDKFPTPIYATTQDITDYGLTFTNAYLTGSWQSSAVNGRWSTKDYFNSNGCTTLKCYSVLKHLGITQDQFLYDYQDMSYFDSDIPRWTLPFKFAGNVTVNGFDGLIISRLRGLTEGTYIGPMGATFGLDLPGFNA